MSNKRVPKLNDPDKLLSLLAEYTQKLRMFCDEFELMRDRSLIKWVGMGLCFLIAGLFFAWFSDKGYFGIDTFFAILLTGISFFIAGIAYVYWTDHRRSSRKTFELDTTARVVENLIRLSSQLVEHAGIHESYLYEFELRLTEAEMALWRRHKLHSMSVIEKKESDVKVHVVFERTPSARSQVT